MWNATIVKVEKRLACWKILNYSKGGETNAGLKFFVQHPYLFSVS